MAEIQRFVWKLVIGIYLEFGIWYLEINGYGSSNLRHGRRSD